VALACVIDATPKFPNGMPRCAVSAKLLHQLVTHVGAAHANKVHQQGSLALVDVLSVALTHVALALNVSVHRVRQMLSSTQLTWPPRSQNFSALFFMNLGALRLSPLTSVKTTTRSSRLQITIDRLTYLFTQRSDVLLHNIGDFWGTLCWHISLKESVRPLC